MGPDKPAKSAVVPDHLAESGNVAEQEIAKGVQLDKGASMETAPDCSRWPRTGTC